MRVWAVANQKGGVGKTSSSVSLAGIAAAAGKRVLLIDIDAHGSLSAWFGINPDQIQLSVFDLFEQRASLNTSFLHKLIKKNVYPGVDLIPSAVVLATLERRAVGEGMGLVLKKSLALVEAHYDLVIIDCPPQLGVLLVNALAASDLTVVPVQTEYLAIQGLERMLNTLNMMQQSRGAALQHCVVPVMYDKRTQASVHSLRQIRMDYGAQVWPGKIPIDTRLRDASKAGVPIHSFAPQSRAAQAYAKLYKYLLSAQQSEAA
ncbi:ParA family protein [Agaribacterium haliotis]|uniref:ParA family protein n=1 Tax=Agaribacterium haliotis TaxID=2013869 RepID=UPI000BB59310|nr:ParA family protein [Agaribacterium haliotis]